MDNSIAEGLAANYMQGELKIQQYSGTKTNKEISDEITKLHGASADAGRFVQKLFAGASEELNDAQRAYSRLRTWWYANSLPWVSGGEGASKRGPRLIATVDVMDKLTEFKELHDAAKVARQRFQDALPQARAKAAVSLGTIYNEDDYPTPDSIRYLFSATFNVTPLPAITDYSRLSIPPALAEGLSKQYEKIADARVTEAMNDLSERTLKALDTMVTSLGKVAADTKTPDAKGRQRGPRLYQSMLDNLKHMTGMLRSMNLTNDGVMLAIADDIEGKLLKYELDQFKGNPTLAATVQKEAEQIQATLKSSEDVVEVEPQDGPEEVVQAENSVTGEAPESNRAASPEQGGLIISDINSPQTTISDDDIDDAIDNAFQF